MEPAKGLFALPFMRRAQERRRAQAQADTAAMLRELEAADARMAGGSDEDADDWTAAQPAERSGRLRFGSSRQQPQDEVRLVFAPATSAATSGYIPHLAKSTTHCSALPANKTSSCS